MKTSLRLALKLLCALALVGAIVAAFTNQNSLALARTQNQSLRNDRAEYERLAAENAEIEKLRETNEEVKKLRQDTVDLPRLRNEVRRLREQAAEAARLRADNQRLASAKGVAAWPADFIPRSAIVDAGFSTPEATIQTYLHAALNGDIRRVAQCQALTESEFNTFMEAYQNRFKELIDDESRMLGKIAGIRIAQKTLISAHEADIGVQNVPGGAIMHMKMKLIGSEWKLKN